MKVGLKVGVKVGVKVTSTWGQGEPKPVGGEGGHPQALRVQRCSGAEVERCRSAEVQRCRGTEVQRCRGAEVQRCSGAEVQRWRVKTCRNSQGMGKTTAPLFLNEYHKY